MRIAVNAVNAGYPDGNGTFIMEYFFCVAQQLPQHVFIFIAGNPVDTKYDAAKNITVINSRLSITTPVRLQYWLRFKLPAILKENNASLLVSNGYCPLKSKLPQLLFITDLSFIQYPQFYKKSWLQFYKKNMPAFLKKATALVTLSALLKKESIALNKEISEKITVIPALTDSHFKPVMHWQQKETAKEKFTSGKEYFLYNGQIDAQKNIIYLLKAFSFFKQRQKSNMLLVLASGSTANKSILQSLASYKYRTEVVVAEKLSVSDMASLTAAAYAVVYPVLYDAKGMLPLQAIHCDVPVIASDAASLKEIFGPAALYFNPDDFNDIADKMMLVFKNEDERNILIARGRELARLYNNNTSATLLDKIITEITIDGDLNQ